MLALIAVLTALAVVALTVLLVQLAPGRATVSTRLDQIHGHAGAQDVLARRRRQQRADRVKTVLQALGERIEAGRKDTTVTRLFLVQAGFPDPGAPAIYWATRVTLTAGLALTAILALPLLQLSAIQVLLGTIWAGVLGWVFPTFYVRSKLKARQKEVQKALPDMLDMLVVCVEAGLGLNQALVRVSDEIDHVSPVTSEQLAILNLEMRAGTPRDEALKNLAERTGLQDIKSLVSMLIQTDRFGTSVADALRIHSDTMRTKRRQRAEEAAAKTTIKLVFPLVLFVFPAMFAVVLGPSVIQIYRMFVSLK
jgi:tight adherence protein C